MNLILKDSLGIILVIAGLLDAWKYTWQAKGIKKVGTAKGHSRKFLNAAILNDTIKLLYSLIINDIFIFSASILALGTMFYNYYIVYKYYPYRMRGCSNFKRPNILLYILNSLQPNRIRKRL
jgi:hypothetical protein